MKIPTHLLAIELHPDDPTHDAQPPLPSLPCPDIRLRVHQFHLTATMAPSADTKPVIESVDAMDYIAPEWHTFTRRSTDAVLTSWRAKEAVSLSYEYLTVSGDFHLSWKPQQYLEKHSKSLEGQTWRQCLGWASKTLVSDRSCSLRYWEAARRFLQVYTESYLTGQSRSQLWVGVGLSRERLSPPRALVMSPWGTGIKKGEGSRV